MYYCSWVEENRRSTCRTKQGEKRGCVVYAHVHRGRRRVLGHASGGLGGGVEEGSAGHQNSINRWEGGGVMETDGGLQRSWGRIVVLLLIGLCLSRSF